MFGLLSIVKHLDEWKCYLQSLKIEFSVIGVTETWLNESNVDVHNFEGYRHIFNQRK